MRPLGNSYRHRFFAKQHLKPHGVTAENIIRHIRLRHEICREYNRIFLRNIAVNPHFFPENTRARRQNQTFLSRQFSCQVLKRPGIVNRLVLEILIQPLYIRLIIGSFLVFLLSFQSLKWHGAHVYYTRVYICQ